MERFQAAFTSRIKLKNSKSHFLYHATNSGADHKHEAKA